MIAVGKKYTEELWIIKKKCRMGVCSDKLMSKVVTLDCIFALK
jgi:hypothetical protein